jgi:hypothetical protein
MALSGDISGTLVARDIARMAMQMIGGPLENGEVTTEDGQLITTLLNFMLKTWQSQGCNLWRLSDESVVFLANTKTVQLNPRVLDVMEARFVGDVTYQRELARYEWGDYRMLPNKDSQGNPTCYTLNKQRTYIEMTLWPVATEDIEIRYSGARVIQDVNDLNDEVDVPQEWIETVWTCLAERMIPYYNIDTLSAAVAQRITQRAQVLYAQMLDFDRPASTFMKPWQAPGYPFNY